MPGTAFSAANWSGYDEQSVTNPSSALTDFTLLIDVSTLSASWKAAVQSDAGDIRITKGDGTTELAYDLIDWAYNAGAPTGWIRVLWSGSLASSGTQNVRVYAGYTPGTAVAYDATETYGSDNAYDANWEGYWPLGGGTDRTSNSNDLTAYGGVTVGGAAGKTGNATAFDGSDDRCEIASAVVAADPMTMMCWFNAPDVTGFHRLIQIDDNVATSTAKDMYLIQAAGAVAGDPVQVNAYRGAASGAANTSTSYSASTWHHAAGVFASDASRTAYLDSGGAVEETTSRAVDAVSITRIGALYFDGTLYYSAQTISEAQIHSVARSAAWIASEYAQSNDQAAFWGTWAWTATAGGTSILVFMHHYKQMGAA